MKVSGRDLISVLCNRLEDIGSLCHDVEIVRFLKTLTAEQLWQIVSFGDVQKWHNERVNKQANGSTSNIPDMCIGRSDNGKEEKYYCKNCDQVNYGHFEHWSDRGLPMSGYWVTEE